MAKVLIWGSLQEAAGSGAETEIEARNVRELLERLVKAHPGLKPQIERGISISVDGTIYHDSCLAPVGPESEVVLLPRLAGG